MKTYKHDHKGRPLPENKCATCGYDMSVAEARSADEAPEPGGIALCGQCGEIYMINADMTFSTPTLAQLMEFTPEEHRLISKDQELIRAHAPGAPLPPVDWRRA